MRNNRLTSAVRGGGRGSSAKVRRACKRMERGGGAHRGRGVEGGLVGLHHQRAERLAVEREQRARRLAADRRRARRVVHERQLTKRASRPVQEEVPLLGADGLVAVLLEQDAVLAAVDDVEVVTHVALLDDDLARLAVDLHHGVDEILALGGPHRGKEGAVLRGGLDPRDGLLRFRVHHLLVSARGATCLCRHANAALGVLGGATRILRGQLDVLRLGDAALSLRLDLECLGLVAFAGHATHGTQS